MSVKARMADGSERELSAHYGDTVDEVVAALTMNTLTGSAVPLADEMVKLADGGSVAYAEIDALADDQPF